MQSYDYTVEVINTFKDTITVTVEAEHAGVARKIIREAMNSFPNKIPHDSIKNCFIENREKVSAEVGSITRTIQRPTHDETA